MEPLSMLLMGLASQAIPDIYQGAKDWWRGPQPADPNVQAQQNYLQQIQQPINMGMGNRQQQLMDQFQQQLIPGIQEQFAGAGGMRSSAFGQQMGGAGRSLMNDLGALGEQNQYQNQALNLQRLGELRGHLGQQQGFGLQAQQMGQNFNLGQQNANTNRMGAFAGLLGNLGGMGMARQYDTVNRPGQNAGIEDFFTQLQRAYLNH